MRESLSIDECKCVCWPHTGQSIGCPCKKVCLVHSKAELYVNLRNVLMCRSLGKVSACQHVYKELLMGMFTVSITDHQDFVHLKLIRVFVGSSPCRLTQGHGCARVSHWTGIFARIDFSFLMRLAKVASVKSTRLSIWSRCVPELQDEIENKRWYINLINDNN